MTSRTALFVAFCFIFCFSIQAQIHYPGGVPDAEVWYKADPNDIGTFENYAETDIDLTPNGGINEGLLNFNPAIDVVDQFYLHYSAPLEQSSNRAVFIVTEPRDNQNSYPHVGTRFNDFVPSALGSSAYLDSLSRNTFVVETQQGYASRMTTTFSQHQNAHVHFYSWSNYDIDKKFKSFGKIGETDFFIGKKISIPELDNGPEFSGLFPEYLAFDRELTKNERNRVESYLALKYGITKWNTEDYQNSKNKIFWDQANNSLFGNNIFGIGKDDISGLNQLQCESAHNKDYLVGAVAQVMGTNAEVQSNYQIPNNTFIVFGDTGSSGIANPDGQHQRRLNKVWLSQVTGRQAPNIPIHFRLDLTNEFQPFINQIQAGQLTVWMLHDRYTNNTEVSDFDNGNVEFYTPVSIENAGGKVYAHYNELFFDRDKSFFDQFTFAVGPEMLVQIRYLPWQCSGECAEIQIVITGGQPNHTVELRDEQGNPVNVQFDPEASEPTDDFIYRAVVCGNNMDYEVDVYDATSLHIEETFTVEAQNHTLDLGPDQNFTSGNTEILLDAGQGINDPNATYQWYYNGEQIYHTESTLLADQPGNYSVVVTTSDMSCQLEDEISLDSSFGHGVNEESGCTEEENTLYIYRDGVAPFTTNVSGNGLNVTYVHQSDTTLVDFPDGNYTVTITDALGNSGQNTISFNSGASGGGSFGPDQTLSLTQPEIILDGAAAFGGNPGDYTYQWYRDGVLLSETGSELSVEIPGDYTVVAVHSEGDCDGEASIRIDHKLEGYVEQDGDCDEFSNTLNIHIDYGIPPYETEISGTQYADGSPYTQTITHDGDATVSDIPYGDYTVTLTDSYQGTIEEDIEFTGLMLDIHSQLEQAFEAEDWGHAIVYGICEDGTPAIIYDPDIYFSLDASSLIEGGGQNISYEWFVDGESLNYNDPIMSFVPGNLCYEDIYDVLQYPCMYGTRELAVYTVTIVDNSTGCTLSQSFASIYWYCPEIYNSTATRPSGSSIITNVYPNPSDQDATFYYDVASNADEVFEGTVEVFSVTGALIHRADISGKSSYSLPFSIMASGVYFIRTTSGTTTEIDRIIIK